MPEDPFEPARQTSTAVLEREETVTQPVEPGTTSGSATTSARRRSSRAPSRVSRSPPRAARSGCLGAIPRSSRSARCARRSPTPCGVPRATDRRCGASGPATSSREGPTRGRRTRSPRVLVPLDWRGRRHAGRRSAKARDRASGGAHEYLCRPSPLTRLPRSGQPGVPAPKLRAWQEGALAAYLEHSAAGEKDFLTVATPGAGKTTYALQVATELLDRGLIREVTVVAPTEHLKHQWADAAARVGIHLNPAFANSVAVQSHEYGGVALTYAQVASRPDLHRQRTLARPTLVILDEIHHGGDAKSWGDAIREAFEPATRRLGLTGTPSGPTPARSRLCATRWTSRASCARQPTTRMGMPRPCGQGRPAGALPRLRRRDAVADQGRRRVAARLGEPMTKDAAAQAWRTALDPKGGVDPLGLRAADKRLTEVRRHVPDAGAMVIASNQTAARAYARHLGRSPAKPTVVLSDDSGASTRIEEYAAGTSRWLVAVRMVSEASTSPVVRRRLCDVHVHAAVLRPGRRPLRAEPRKRGETASVFPQCARRARGSRPRWRPSATTPSTGPPPTTGGLAVGREEGLLAAANRTERTLGLDEPTFEALGPMRTSTTSSSTGSSSACMPLSGPRRNRTTSASQACSNRTRWQPCSTSDRPSRADRRGGARGIPRRPSPPTGRWPRNARNSTRSSRPMRRRRVRPRERPHGTPACLRRTGTGTGQR